MGSNYSGISGEAWKGFRYFPLRYSVEESNGEILRLVSNSQDLARKFDCNLRFEYSYNVSPEGRRIGCAYTPYTDRKRNPISLSFAYLRNLSPFGADSERFRFFDSILCRLDFKSEKDSDDDLYYDFARLIKENFKRVVTEVDY